MGNSEAALEKPTDNGSAKDIVERLGVPYPDGKESKDFSEEEASKLLQEYLDKQSDQDLDNLLLQWGVTKEIISKLNNEKTKKIECLRKVSSPDYWRTNAALHVNFKRVKMWLKVHSNYRQYLSDILKLTNNNNNIEENIATIEKEFNKFETKLIRHTDFEENYLFKFFENLNNDVNYNGLKCLNLDTMHEQHIHSDCFVNNNNNNTNEDNKENKDNKDSNDNNNDNNNNNKSESKDENKEEKESEKEKGNKKQNQDNSWPTTTKDIKAAFNGDKEKIKQLHENIKVYHDEMLDHLLQEERSLVHVWLNLSNEQQKKFTDSLTWVYWVAYGKS